MPTLEDLERRVLSLERAQTENAATMKWMVGTLGQIQATVDDHTERLERIETRIDGLTNRIGGLETKTEGLESAAQRIEADLRGLRRDLPGIVSEALRGTR